MVTDFNTRFWLQQKSLLGKTSEKKWGFSPCFLDMSPIWMTWGSRDLANGSTTWAFQISHSLACVTLHWHFRTLECGILRYFMMAFQGLSLVKHGIFMWYFMVFHGMVSIFQPYNQRKHVQNKTHQVIGSVSTVSRDHDSSEPGMFRLPSLRKHNMSSGPMA